MGKSDDCENTCGLDQEFPFLRFQELGPFLRFNEDIIGHFPKNAPGIPRSTSVYLAAIRSCGRSAGRNGGPWDGWGDPEVFLVMVIS